MKPSRTAIAALALLAALLAAGAGLRAQMGMDARSMSGIPLQTGEVPDGTVIVRVVRGNLSDAVTSHPVELDAGGEVRTATTDESGRAEFTGLRAGTSVKASVVLDGSRVESQQFVVPASGGVRLLLASGAGRAAGSPSEGGGAEAEGAPRRAIPGSIVIGGQSRVIVEFEDDVLEVYYLLDFVNDTGGTLTTASPFVVEAPAGARGMALLEGSSPQSHVDGRSIVVHGPFAPGVTAVQAAFVMPISGPALAIDQAFPAPVQQPAFMVEKVPGLVVSSPQMAAVREMPADNGQVFVTGVGPSLGAGQALTINFAGLPHAATWPRTLALVLAVLILAGGAWAAVGAGRRGEAARRALEERRERAFRSLVQLEHDRDAGRIGGRRYDERRSELVRQLERIYGELDSQATRGDEGQAA